MERSPGKVRYLQIGVLKSGIWTRSSGVYTRYSSTNRRDQTHRSWGAFGRTRQTTSLAIRPDIRDVGSARIPACPPPPRRPSAHLGAPIAPIGTNHHGQHHRDDRQAVAIAETGAIGAAKKTGSIRQPQKPHAIQPTAQRNRLDREGNSDTRPSFGSRCRIGWSRSSHVVAFGWRGAGTTGIA